MKRSQLEFYGKSYGENFFRTGFRWQFSKPWEYEAEQFQAVENLARPADRRVDPDLL